MEVVAAVGVVVGAAVVVVVVVVGVQGKVCKANVVGARDSTWCP